MDREKQIELLRTADERRSESLAAWKLEPNVQASMKRGREQLSAAKRAAAKLKAHA